MRDSLTIQTIILLIGRLSNAGIQIIVPIFLVRVISQSDYGIYKLIFLVQGTVLVFVPMGMIQSLYYFIPKGKNPELFIRQTLVYLHLSCSVIFIIGFFFVEPLSEFIKIKGDFRLFLYVWIICIIPVLSAPLTVLLLSEKKTFIASLVTIGDGVISTIVLLCSVIFFKKLTALIVGLLIYSVLKFLIVEMFFQKKYKIFSLDKISGSSLKAHFGFAIPLGIAGFLGFMQVRIDQYLVSYYFSSAQYATYAVAAFGIPFSIYLYNSIADVTMVRYRQLAAEGNINDMLIVWDKATKRLSTVFIPLVILFMLLADPLIPYVFTEKFREAVPYYRILLILWLSYCFNPASFVRAFNVTRFLMTVQLVCVLASCIALFVLVRYLGMAGAAISTVSIVWLSTILIICKVASLVSKSFFELIPIKHICKTLLVSVFAASFLLLIRLYIDSPLVYLTCSFISFFLIFVIVSWKINILSDEDKALVVKILWKGKVMLQGVKH